jgi:hypothetical protein
MAPLTLPGALIAATERPPEFFSQLFLSRLSSFSPLQRLPPVPANTSSRLRGARFVYVRSPAPALTPAYRGPYRVVEKGEKSFNILVGSRADSVSVDRLKPHVGGEEPVLGLLPRRGRPPTSSSSPAAHH